VVQAGDRAGLALKALFHRAAAGEFRSQHLNRYRAVQARISSLIHFAHAAGSHRPEDLKMSEAGAPAQ
jgi:hypothetical protein